jgi:hypothetical protein
MFGDDIWSATLFVIVVRHRQLVMTPKIPTVVHVESVPEELLSSGSEF